MTSENETADSKGETVDSAPISRRFIVGVLVVIAVFWVLTPVLTFWLYGFFSVEGRPGFPSAESLGAFGDMFGVTNSLFSGLALSALILAIYLQFLELKDQKKQFKQQSLDNTFFQMLGLRNDIIVGLSLVEGRGHVTGYQFLTKQVESFEAVAPSFPGPMDSATNLPEYSSWYWPNHQRSLDHYYNSLETILVLIDECDAIARNRYVLILAGLLSHDEKKLLFYRAVGYKGTQEKCFYMLVAKAGLVDDLDSEKWPSEKKHRLELKEMQKKSLLKRDNQPASG